MKHLTKPLTDASVYVNQEKLKMKRAPAPKGKRIRTFQRNGADHESAPSLTPHESDNHR